MLTLQTSPCNRDSEAAYVSLNGEPCWIKPGITTSQGTQQCGEKGRFGSWNEDVFQVTGSSITLSGSGSKPLTVRVYTNLDAQDAKDESFGIANVIITNVQSSTFCCPVRTSCMYRGLNIVVCDTFTTISFCVFLLALGLLLLLIYTGTHL